MSQEPIRDNISRIRFLVRLKKPCPECGSADAIVDNEAGEIICKKCGLVQNK
jgi:ribosomal protein S27AE